MAVDVFIALQLPNAMSLAQNHLNIKMESEESWVAVLIQN
jgi:hypothetical protein